MKKLITIILILAMLLPAAALAEDRDPIVGSWYMLYDKSLYPEMAANFSNTDLIIMIFSFQEDGTVIVTENDITNGVSKASGAVAGKWEKGDPLYKYSILGMGQGDAYVDEGCIYLNIGTEDQRGYFRMRKMEPMNPYADYIFW